MRSPRLHFVLAWLLIGAVLMVFILPAVDLPDTTLRSQQIADVLFWLLAAAMFLLVTHESSSFSAAGAVAALPCHDFRIPRNHDLVSLLCSRLV